MQNKKKNIRIQQNDRITGQNRSRMRQQHRALGSIKSANPSQSNPDDSDFNFDSDPIFDLQALLSQPLIVSELHRLIFVKHSDGFCIAKTKDTIDSAKNQQTKCKRKGRKEKKKKRDEEGECSGVWRNGREGIKKRRKEGLIKKTERVRVWRRNLVGKKKGKKKKKKEMPCGG